MILFLDPDTKMVEGPLDGPVPIPFHEPLYYMNGGAEFPAVAVHRDNLLITHTEESIAAGSPPELL